LLKTLTEKSLRRGQRKDKKVVVDDVEPSLEAETLSFVSELGDLAWNLFLQTSVCPWWCWKAWVFCKVILGFLPVFCFFFQRFGCRVKIVTPLMLDLEIKKLFSLIENNWVVLVFFFFFSCRFLCSSILSFQFQFIWDQAWFSFFYIYIYSLMWVSGSVCAHLD